MSFTVSKAPMELSLAVMSFSTNPRVRFTGQPSVAVRADTGRYFSSLAKRGFERYRVLDSCPFSMDNFLGYELPVWSKPGDVIASFTSRGLGVAATMENFRGKEPDG
jgi:hypothetical protein